MTQLSISFPDTTHTFADFFSGAGGFSLGMIQAGWKCISAMEIAPDAAWTYWYNLCYKGWSHLWVHPQDEKLISRIKKQWQDGKTSNHLFKHGIPDNWLEVEEPMPTMNLFLYDIMEMEPQEWMELCGVRPGDISVFVGGPPCQGFSTANTSRSVYDERNKLALRMIYYAKIAKPKFILIENVPGLVSLGRKKGEKEGPFVKWIREALDDAGYNMNWKIENMADYGVPQRRKRVLFFCWRKDIVNVYGNIEIEKRDPLNVYEAIGHLPPLEPGEKHQGEAYTLNPRDGYVFCKECLRINSETKNRCHNCGAKMNFPIKGSVSFLPDMGITLLDHKRLSEDAAISFWKQFDKKNYKHISK